MSILFEKIQAFKSNQFPQHQAHYESLAGGQSPHTLLITCSDSRLCPQEFSQTLAGELFVIRNAGNLMPAYNPNEPSNEGLTLEYGVCALNVSEVVVCGHASCGAMGGLKDVEKLDSLPIVQKALKNYRQQHQSEVSGKTVDQLISWNVDNQLKSIFSYPFIQERLKNKELKVFGLVYDFVTGEVTYSSYLSESGEVSS